MGAISAAEFEKEIKSAVTKNIYYIYGRDTGRVKSLADMVKKKFLGEGFLQSDISRFEGREFDLSVFSDTAEIYPMFSDYNFIEINDLDADSLNADEMKLFLKILENLPDQTILLISITGFDIKGGKKTPSAKNKKVIDAAAKYGSVTEADLRKPSEMYKFIMKLASENGSSINKQNAEKLAELCMGNTTAAENEVNKLSAFAGNGEITYQMIDEMVPVSIDTNAFALASAVVSSNVHSAMRILDKLVQQRTESVMILSALSSAFIDLYRASAAISSSVGESEAAADFGYKGREFVMKNAFRDARKTTPAHLRKCLCILRQADLECKSTRLDQKIIIEKAIAQMLSAGNGE